MTTAASSRRRLGEIGRDIAAQEGPPARRRADRLRSAAADRGAVPLAGMADLPDWLRLPRAAQVRLARHAGLASISASLARSIDGSWLGDHAELAGEDAVESAIAADPVTAARREMPPVAASELDARGFAILASLLPAAAHGLLDWAPQEALTPERDRAEACFAAARSDFA